MSKLNAFITVSKRALLLFSMIKSKKVHTSKIFVMQGQTLCSRYCIIFIFNHLLYKQCQLIP